METRSNVHPPEMGPTKNFTQVISLIVGFMLFVLGLSGILFDSFAGLHLSVIYSIIISISGAMLLYNGYQNKSRYAFLCCLGFGLFFGIHALAGWTLGQPGIPRVGFESPDPNWLVIIPNFHELGRNDHILNTILTLVLMGGALDWFRRHNASGHSTELFRNIKNDYVAERRARTKTPIAH